MNIDGRGLQFYTDARIESKTQGVNARVVRPPSPTGWIDSVGAGYLRTDIENLVTRTSSVIARRRAMDERRTPAFGIGYYWDDQTPQDQPTESSRALYVEARLHVAQRRQPVAADAGMDGHRACRRRRSRRVDRAVRAGDRARRPHGGRCRARTNSTRARTRAR